MPKILTPLRSGSNTRFRYLNRGQPAPRQPAGAPSIIWSSCATEEGKGFGGSGGRLQTAFGFTEKGTQLINQAQGAIAGGLFDTLSGKPLGIAWVVFGFVQAAYANTEYVQFSRPCSDNKETGF